MSDTLKSWSIEKVTRLISSLLKKNQGIANAGKFMKVGSDGNLIPANVPDPSNKADKVQNPTAGNFAGLDANGNLTDSGKKPSDFLTQHQDISGKVDKNQGTANAGKALGINSQGQVVPVPFSGEDFTGATAASAGTHGYVPAPQTTDTEKFLCGDGTWADIAGGKLVTFELDTVTGTGGAYSHTTSKSDASHSMKPVLIEVSNPDTFLAAISILCTDGGITLSCDDVNGSSTVTVSCLFKANPDSITSSEFDVLANRIGTIGNLKTTKKSNLVGATNELYDDIAETREALEQTQDGLGIGADGDTHAAVSFGQFVYVRNHDTLANGLYTASAPISANDALSTSNLTPDGSGGLNTLKSDIDALSSNLTLLWQSTATELAPTTINLDLSKYNAILVVHNGSQSPQFIPKGSAKRLMNFSGIGYSDQAYIGSRLITVNENNVVIAEGGYTYIKDGGSAHGTSGYSGNLQCIPKKIYGVINCLNFIDM